MAVLLDDEFLGSLGIKEGLLPQRSATDDGSTEVAKTGQNLPMAGRLPVPSELFDLNPEELEELIKEQHSQENPYVYLMPGSRHTVAVYPCGANEFPETMDRYDMVVTAQEFMNMVAVSKRSTGVLRAYKTKEGKWFYV
jgi:hypothetical protein